ncbi:DUF488 domain-containing protein [Bartonella rattimassiliensis]|uniref:DUF488 domain-containing protein n=1 Tax=Bartonella rattimassiliensis TaxID=270250 RepID=UPI001FCA9291|nr:DUF488 domain-containing protein [Bartonella rattimassiliensis]
MENNIKILCDVRKNPISRERGFSKGPLEKALSNIDIEYIYICPNLELLLKNDEI